MIGIKTTNKIVHNISLLKFLRQSQFVRNVSTVATGLFAAQILSLAFSPFLTRIYSPEAFGLLAAFVAVKTIVDPATTLGYSTAIVLPTNDQEATAVARLSVFCAFCLTPILFVFIWWFQAPLAELLNFKEHSRLLYLIPLSTFLAALLSVAEQMAIRESLFKARAFSKVFSALLQNSGKLLLGFFVPNGLALISMTIAGVGMNYKVLLTRVPRQGGFQVREWFGTKDIWTTAKKHCDFPFYRMPQSVINAMALGLPVLLLSALFGAATAGQYSLTSLVLGAPVLLLGKSVLDVFYPKITREIARDRRKAAYLLQKATKVSALMTLVIFGPIALLSPWLFPVLFGEQWAQAGLLAQWVSLWMAGVVVSRPAVATYPALGLQKHLLALEVFGIALRTLALYVGAIAFTSPLLAVALFALASTMNLIILMILAFVRIAEDDI